MRKQPEGKPITIAEARERCNGVQVHCLRCAQMTVLSLDRFSESDVVADLAKRRRFRCQRCGGSWVATRPNYISTNDSRTWYGLEHD
ncbi:hypothetical protein [Roseibium sediminicola]|uniref:Uncharacterized protein n=1 Tax=Roseibium sediminicola TaxID=2933272 RepID=A0ABT0H0F9_9HYPH|nr:hypothetical protein [Roseibium sp. CAU 1639]MCK7615164.1 hypothetical protein [Roseibium sp. CAU 1639]